MYDIRIVSSSNGHDDGLTISPYSERESHSAQSRTADDMVVHIRIISDDHMTSHLGFLGHIHKRE